MLGGQEFRDRLEIFLAVRFEGSDDGVPVLHGAYRTVGTIGGPECILGIHDPQVLADAGLRLGRSVSSGQRSTG